MNSKKMICEECGAEVVPVEIDESVMEARCPKCGEWFFYGILDSERANHAKPDDGTEQCKREYDGKTDYRY